jgi:hypothetical protein
MPRPRPAHLAILASLATCAPRPASTPPPSRPDDIGTPDPFKIVDLADDGAWIVLCQPRDGAAAAPYLIRGAGPGERLDEFVAAGSDGDLLVVITGGRLLLHDRLRGRVLDLTARGADPRDDTAAHRSHRAAAVDGLRVAYWRDRSVVVLDVVTDREQVVAMPVTGGHRLALAGPWLLVHPVAPDAALEPPGTAPARACAPSGPPIARPPAPTWVAHLDAAAAAPRPDLVTTWGDRLVVRAADGSLQLETGAGARELLTPGECRAALGPADADRENFLIACEGQRDPAGRAPLAILSRAALDPLPLRVPASALPGLRLLGRQVWDLAALAGRPPGIVGAPDPWDTRTLAVHGDHALIHQDGRYAVVDVGDRVRVDLELVDPAAITPSTFPQQGPLVALGPYLIDLRQMGTGGRFEGTARALASDWRILVSAGPEPRGPLRWVRARPAR